MKKCLVVDDNANNRMVARFIMEDLGFTTEEVGAADEAAALLVVEDFDVVLLDWMMPQMDGVDYLTRLRQDERLKDVKVIICSAKERDANLATVMNAGANGFIAKPLTLDVVEKQLKELGLL
ncbi:MAG: response regulator [Rickettsiales bacterium]